MLKLFEFGLVSRNNLIGTILFSLYKLKNLRGLDLSKNQLSGDIPDCRDQSSDLEYLNLAHNDLNCHLPRSISFLGALLLLDLSKNGFSRLPRDILEIEYFTLFDILISVTIS